MSKRLADHSFAVETTTELVSAKAPRPLRACLCGLCVYCRGAAFIRGNPVPDADRSGAVETTNTRLSRWAIHWRTTRAVSKRPEMQCPPRRLRPIVDGRNDRISTVVGATNPAKAGPDADQYYDVETTTGPVSRQAFIGGPLKACRNDQPPTVRRGAATTRNLSKRPILDCRGATLSRASGWPDLTKPLIVETTVTSSVGSGQLHEGRNENDLATKEHGDAVK